ncbi:MAG: dephospho-CoA kinase [Rikenellaceae bacterium]|nr:dephospho-CoA kinase [Rikenellaceae bacterium]
MIRIGLTGGIGSGKSTVCRLFEEFGARCYDSDSRAKWLMQNDEELRAELIALFGEEVYGKDGALDRARLAAEVFGNSERLAALNGAVHPAVGRDWERWCEAREAEGAAYTILESAILFDCGFDSKVDRTVAVLAPEELRIERAAKRDNAPAEVIRRRIEAQMSDAEREARAHHTIRNIDIDTLREQVEELHKLFSDDAQ